MPLSPEAMAQMQREPFPRGAASPAFVEERIGVTTIMQPLPRPTVRRGRTNRIASQFAHSAIASPVTLWVLLDTLMVFVGVYCSHVLSPSFDASEFSRNYWAPKYHWWAIGAIYALALFLCSHALGLFQRRSFNSSIRLATACLGSNLLAVSCTTLFFSWFRYIPIGRYVLLLTVGITTCGNISYRLVMRWFAGRQRIRVIFVGRAERFASLVDAMIRGYGGLYAEPTCVVPSADETHDDVIARCAALRPDVLVLEDESELVFRVLESSTGLFASGIRLRSLSAFHEDLLHEVRLDALDYRSLLASSWACGDQTTENLKRVVDVTVASVGLLLALPLMAFAALAVRLTSRGPVLYRQTRVGRFGVPFEIVKFRTMQRDAEADGVAWAARGDVRVTPVGRILRRTRMDELPQLWNILKGEMSFVGPRPERPEIIAELERSVPHYQLRHLVPPGLTGWAQIRYQYGASVEDARRKLAFDLYYVRHYSVRFDLGICLKTVLAIGRGAR